MRAALASQSPVGDIVAQIECAVKNMYKSQPMEDAQPIGDESEAKQSQDRGSKVSSEAGAIPAIY